MTGEPEQVFIVGCPRSGTTMLYNILQGSGEFPLYSAETHLMDVCRARHGDLGQPANFARFMKEFLNSEQFARSGLNREEFAAEAEGHHNTWAEFLDFFMTKIAQLQGKGRWCDNTPLNAQHLEELARELPRARFIHIVRDGRDVAMSLRKLGWTGLGRGTAIQRLVAAAIFWEMVVGEARAAGKLLGERYLEVSYCKLIADPASELTRIGRHLGIEFDAGLAGNALYGNSAFGAIRGISRDPVQRWRRNMSEEECHAVQMAIGQALVNFGYELDEKANGTQVSQSVRLICRYYPGLLRLKNYLRTRTPLRKFSRSRLEQAQAAMQSVAMMTLIC